MPQTAEVESALKVLLNPMARLVFRRIVRERRVRFKHLSRELREAGEGAIDEDELKRILEDLQAVHLVQALDAVPSEFTTYYITPAALSAERKLRRVGLDEAL